MKTVGCLAALSLLLFASSADAAPKCAVPLIRLLNNQTVSGTMYATSGKQCSIVTAHSGGPMSKTDIIRNANNGKVVLLGNRIVYTSKPNFVGEDSFSYIRRGLTNTNEPLAATVNVTVQVAANTL